MKINDWLTLDPAEILFSFVRSSGPGGQNVNKVSTACELRFDARRSASLPADVAVRLLKLAGSRATKEGVIVIFADQQRSQEGNRREAMSRLEELVVKAAIRPAKRVATRPTAASRKKRLEGKAKLTD
jgi:ribosome-associated protein